MVVTNLILGWAFLKLFNKQEAKSPQGLQPVPVPVPPLPSGDTRPQPTPTPPPPPPPPPPPFPTDVQPTPAPSADFKKAVEVWQVRTDVAALKDSPFVVGAIGEVNEATALNALERSFSTGWRPATVVTEAEKNMAVALVNSGKWQDGKVLFLGPATLAGRRAFRMTKHPKTQPAPVPHPVTPTPAPAPVPVPPPPPPLPGGDALSRPPVPAPTPPVPPPPPPPQALQETAVRPGEGLAQVGKRLGRPESAATASELRAQNLAQSPEPAGYVSIALKDGGMRRKDRKTGGLQPGDRLFVPAAWGTIDPARL